jgi:hypothetical protein
MTTNVFKSIQDDPRQAKTQKGPTLRYLTSGQRLRRAVRIAPLFDYMREHGIRFSHVREQLNIQRSRIYQIESGLAPTPEHFIEDACRVIGVEITTIYPDWPHISEELPKASAA